MKNTLTALVVAAGVAGFAGAAFAGCAGHQSVQGPSSKPIITADAEQSTPVVTTATTGTAKN